MDLAQALDQGIAPWDDLALDLDTVKVFRDRYPVTPGHRLFVPVSADAASIAECFRQAYRLGQIMVERGSCDGFNVGLNLGAAAGQTVQYPHVHLIPRRSGDCEDPTGGVRGVIPGQADYRGSHYRNPRDT